MNVIHELTDGIGRITLSRPTAHNAFDLEMATDLASATVTFAADARVRTILIGSEGRMFSAGGDVAAFAARDDLAALLRQIARQAHHAISVLASAPKPVVCAVQGPAAGLGMGLALVADHVVAAESASFVAGYTAIGLTPDGGLSHLLPRLVGLRRAQELIYTNRRLSASEAAEWGLITKVVPDGELEEAAAAAAASLAKGSASAFAMSKGLLARDWSLVDALAFEADTIATASATSDGREGVASFAARRPPRFA